MLAVVAEGEEEGICHLEKPYGVGALSSTDSGRRFWNAVVPEALIRTVGSGITIARSSRVKVPGRIGFRWLLRALTLEGFVATPRADQPRLHAISPAQSGRPLSQLPILKQSLHPVPPFHRRNSLTRRNVTPLNFASATFSFS